MKHSSLRHHTHHIDKKLQFRLRLYFFIAIGMLLLVGYDLYESYLTILLAAIGILIGVGVGVLTARMFHISWDHNAKKVMARLDTFGIIILIGYIAFALLRSKLIGYFVDSSMVTATGFAVIAGIMIGRVLGTRGRILKVLQEQKII